MEINPIETIEEYQIALEEIETYLKTAPNSSEAKQLDLLSQRVASYEHTKFPIPSPDPIELLRYYMDTRGWTHNDLESCFGDRATLVEVLTRQRPLNLEMIHKLHHKLGIPTAILTQSDE